MSAHEAREVLQRAVCALLRIPPVEAANRAPGMGPGTATAPPPRGRERK